MKADLIQGDFSSGELTPRLHGHVTTDVYKTGLDYCENFLPTQQGALTSRAGAQVLTDGEIGPNSDGYPASIIPLQGGPLGDTVLRIAHGAMSMYNRWGIMPLRYAQDLTAWFEDASEYSDNIWTDPEKHELHFRNTGSLVDAWVTMPLDVAAMALGGACADAMLQFEFFGSDPTPTDNKFRIYEYDAGGVVVRVTAPTAGLNQIVLQPTTVNLAFYALGDPAAVGDFGNIILAGRYLGAWVTEMNVPGVVSGPELRWTQFWSKPYQQLIPDPPGVGFSNNFYLYLTGPGMVVTRIMWAGGTWTCTNTGLFSGIYGKNALIGFTTYEPPWNMAGNVVAIHAYQGRLWLGLNDTVGSVLASALNFFGYESTFSSVIQIQSQMAIMLTTNSTGAEAAFTARWGDKVDITNDVYHVFMYVPASGLLSELMIPTTVVATHTAGSSLNETVLTFQGGFTPTIHSKVWVTRQHGVSGASDALDLKIAQPTGSVAWFQELRGLLMGTTRSEYVFSSGALAIDPVSGSSFDITKHSSFGSDPKVLALPVLDKVLFAPPGRKRIRMMGESIQTAGGLVAQDVSLFGEHILEKRIRCMAFVRAPTPRLVVGFDDGTGAIGTVHDDSKMLAWSRFTLSEPYDIYSLASIDTKFSSELWIGTSAGEVLVIPDLDSKVAERVHYDQNTSFQYYPFPEPPIPVMDGWKRMPAKGRRDFFGLPTSWFGKSVWVLVNGVLAQDTPIPVNEVSGVILPNAVAPFYTDANGINQINVVMFGLAYPGHKFVTLPWDGGNPAGTAQNYQSRAVQCYLRLVDSFVPLVGGVRGVPERQGTDPFDAQASRITKDVRATQLGFERGRKLTVEQDYPLRVEISAIFGGTQVSSF